MITVTPYVDAKASQRYAAQMSAMGYYAETLPRLDTFSQVMISQTIYYVTIGLLAGDVVTNLHAIAASAGSAFATPGMKMALYDKTGVQLATSADVASSFTSAGLKKIAMASPYTVPTTDGYFATVWGSGTMPQLYRGTALSASAGNAAFAGASMGSFSATTGASDLPTPGSITYPSTGIAWWIGVS